MEEARIYFARAAIAAITARECKLARFDEAARFFATKAIYLLAAAFKAMGETRGSVEAMRRALTD